MDLAIDSAKSFVVDLAALAENFTEAPEDVEWFEKLHPSLVKAYCPHDAVDENEAPASSSSSTTTRQLSKKSAKDKQSVSSSKARGGLGSTARHGGQPGKGNSRRTGAGAGAGGRTASNSRNIQSTKPITSRKKKSTAAMMTASAATSSRKATTSRKASSEAKRHGRDRPGPGAAAAAAAAAEDDDIAALLAKHNKQFKPKSRYVARTHSSRDVKRWEVATGKKWYELGPDGREQANEEIAAMIAEERANKND